MSNPYDDNSTSSGTNPIDDLLHQLGLEQHHQTDLHHSEAQSAIHELLHPDGASDRFHHQEELARNNSCEHHNDSFHRSDGVGAILDRLSHPEVSLAAHQLIDRALHPLSNNDPHPLIDRAEHPLINHAPHPLSHDVTNHLINGSSQSLSQSSLSPENQQLHQENFASTSGRTEFHHEGSLTAESINQSEYHVNTGLKVYNYTESGAIEPDDARAVDIQGNDVWWHGYGWGKAGTIDGHKFYRNDECIGRLGADLKVYDADGRQIGYVTPSGRAYTTNDKLFACGGTARWAAATLVFNTCTAS